jgi:hypothetical protein
VSVAGFLPLLLARSVPADGPAPAALPPGTKIVSFKLFFDERAQFPQTIRQSTIERLLGGGYELADPSASTAGHDWTVEHDGGVISLRAPENAKSSDIVSKLERLGRIRLVKSY